MLKKGKRRLETKVEDRRFFYATEQRITFNFPTIWNRLFVSLFHESNYFGSY